MNIRKLIRIYENEHGLENRGFHILYIYSIHIRIPNEAIELGIKYRRASSKNPLVRFKCLIPNMKNYVRTSQISTAPLDTDPSLVMVH